MSEVKSVEVVKAEVDAKLKAGESVAGMQFVNSKGSVGTILPTLSLRGKLQASMTCIEGGPDHIRERSDWHQCYLSPEKAKNKPRKTGGPGTGKSMRTEDGTLLRFQEVLPTDTEEIVALKLQSNEAFEAAKLARQQVEADAKAAKQAARKAKQEEARTTRAAAKAAENAAKLAKSVALIESYNASLTKQDTEPTQPDATA